MGAVKQYLEQRSYELGFDGDLSEEVVEAIKKDNEKKVKNEKNLRSRSC